MCTKHEYFIFRETYSLSSFTIYCLRLFSAGVGRGADGWPSGRPSCWGPGWGSAGTRPWAWAAPRAARGTPGPGRPGARPVRRSCYRSENIGSDIIILHNIVSWSLTSAGGALSWAGVIPGTPSMPRLLGPAPLLLVLLWDLPHLKWTRKSQ